MTSLSEKQWRVTFLTLRDCVRVCVSFSTSLAKDVEVSGWFVTIWEAVSSHASWKLRPKIAEERRRTVLLTKRFEASDSHFPRLLHNLFIALLFNYGLLFQAGLSQEAFPEEQEGKKEVETERGREREVMRLKNVGVDDRTGVNMKTKSLCSMKRSRWYTGEEGSWLMRISCYGSQMSLPRLGGRCKAGNARR